jgi:anhydro-N-acetylmuramic acid kinase
MANVTVLPPGTGRQGVTAFDTGPGNVLIDEFVRHATGGAMACDEDGRLAAAGRVDHELLEGFLEHPYFFRHPPKSTGREVFGAGFVALTLGEWAGRRERVEDLVATLTEFTAISVTESIKAWVAPDGPVDRILVSGGGLRNPTLMRRIREELDGIAVESLETVGFSPDAKEAVAFAFLARETVLGRPGNVPGATGARAPVVLGRITLPPRPAAAS